MDYDKSKVYLEVRTLSEMTPDEARLLELSGLGGYGNVEIWSACGTNQRMAYSTHGAFRYFGKFPPPIATHLIETYTRPGDTVFDPMCGSGTTGVEALLNDRACILNDVSPLSTLLARVKTTFLPEDRLRAAAEQLYAGYRPRTEAEYNFTPSYLKNYSHWFLPETVDSLRGLKYGIEQIEEPAVRDFFRVCFAAIVRRVSRATTQQGRLFLDAATAEKDALPFFQRRVDSAIPGVSSLPRTGSVEIGSLDLRDPLPRELTDRADLVICHPPYFNSYKYSSINSLELAWLGVDYAQLRRREVREFFKVGKEANAPRYEADMVETLVNLHPALKDNARMGLMIGDTTIHGNYIPVTAAILDRIQDYYAVELVALRAPKYTEAAWVASQRRQSGKVGVTLYDFIIVLRKR